MLSSVSRPPRFLRGARQITAFYNQHAAEPVSVEQMFKIISRGLIPVGRDGRSIIAEENAILDRLQRLTGATAGN